MNALAEIQNEIRQALSAAGEKPDFLLLTNAEWFSIKTDPDVLRMLNFNTIGVREEVWGLPVVIEGSAQHQLFLQQGRRALRPKAVGSAPSPQP